MAPSVGQFQRNVCDPATGVGVLPVTAAVFMLALLWRLYQVLTHDRREISRRNRLVSELRGFIKVAVRANKEALVRLAEQRIVAHATAHVRSMPVDVVKAVHRVGKQTIAELRAHGFQVLGDIVDGDILNVFQVGSVKTQAISRFGEDQLRGSIEDLRINGAASSVPLDPALERQFEEARQAILTRQTELGTDVEELLEYDDEIARFTEACQRRTTGDRLGTFVRGALDALRHPSRPFSLVLLAALFCGLLFLVPHAALAWDRGLLAPVGVIGAGASWLGLLYLVVTYAVFADRTPFIGIFRLDPRDYRQQRLQFLAIQMSREAGIAPPQLAIAPEPDINAFAAGRPGGPAFVGLNTGLLDQMSTPAVVAVLGHEVGHIAGDHQRLRRTAQLLSSPVRRLSDAVVKAAAWLWFYATRRVASYRGVLFFPVRLGVHSVLLLLLVALALMVAIPVVALSLAFTAIGMAVSRQNEYDADRTSAQLIGSRELMENALAELMAVTGEGTASGGHVSNILWMAYQVHPSQIHPAHQWLADLHDWHRRMGETHPATPRRIAALSAGPSAIGDVLSATVRTAMVVGVCGAALWGSVAGARAAHDRVLTAWTDSPDVVEEDSSGRQAIVLKRPCPLRSSADGQSNKDIDRLPTGATCSIRGRRKGMWYPVTCGGDEGWVSDWCVGKVIRLAPEPPPQTETENAEEAPQAEPVVATITDKRTRRRRCAVTVKLVGPVGAKGKVTVMGQQKRRRRAITVAADFELDAPTISRTLILRARCERLKTVAVAIEEED